MSTVLNEITYQRLQDFRRRRTILASSRGWSAVVTVFIATLCFAVLVDAVSTNGLSRWVASGLIYLATLVTWFWCCWLPKRTPESLQFVAKRFEEMDPRLREQLLTDGKPLGPHGSGCHVGAVAACPRPATALDEPNRSSLVALRQLGSDSRH